MRILISEYLCGGHWPEAEWPVSLMREGRAMLEALLADCLVLPEISLMTTWDARLAPPRSPDNQRLHVENVASPEEARKKMREMAHSADAALIIAPELDGILEQACQELMATGVRLLNCSTPAIQHCTDKLAVYRTCCEWNLPTIPTAEPGTAPRWLPGVIKRRDGAGSTGMHGFWTIADWKRCRAEIAVNENSLEQPWMAGVSCSVAAIFDRGKLKCVFPPALQQISPDGTFRYLGGTIPAPEIPSALCIKTIRKFAEAVPELHSYVGFDFLISESTGSPLLVDVNPRLCTSYVGYRAICDQSLANWLLFPEQEIPPRFSGSVTFSSDGAIFDKSGPQ